MAISKDVKEKRVAEYKELLEQSQALVFATYSGLTMKQLNDLRARLREHGATFQITKNTLFERALSETGVSGLDEILQGMTAVGYLTENIPGSAKVLLDFAAESKAMHVKGGLLGNRVLSAAEVDALSKLPSRDVLLAQLLSRLQGPLYGLVTVLNGPIRGLAYVLKARQEQLAETAA